MDVEMQALTERLEHMTERWRQAEHRVTELTLMCENIANLQSLAEEQSAQSSSRVAVLTEAIEEAARLLNDVAQNEIAGLESTGIQLDAATWLKDYGMES